MKASKTMVLKLVIAFVIVSALSTALLYIVPYLKVFRAMRIDLKQSQQRRVRLLSETDHQALLEACSDLSRKVSAGDLEPGRYPVRGEPDSEISPFPQLITDLEPTYVDLDSDGHVTLEMVGGYHHFGVRAYPEDYKQPSSSYRYGDKQIIDGLWYYEDDYNPDLDKHIEELLQKGK